MITDFGRGQINGHIVIKTAREIMRGERSLVFHIKSWVEDEAEGIAFAMSQGVRVVL